MFQRATRDPANTAAWDHWWQRLRRSVRSKPRWGVSNIGAEQDEGIASTEIKGRDPLPHTPRPPLSPSPRYLAPSKGLLVPFVWRVRGEKRRVLSASDCVCVCVCVCVCRCVCVCVVGGSLSGALQLLDVLLISVTHRSTTLQPTAPLTSCGFTPVCVCVCVCVCTYLLIQHWMFFSKWPETKVPTWLECVTVS